MKIFIDPGHNCPPADTGAVGVINEELEAAKVALQLKAMLIGRGHKVEVSRPTGRTVNESLSQRCAQSNQWGAGLFISLHFNAYEPTDNPRGAEVLVASGLGRKYGQKILDNLEALGFKSRGIKNGANMFVLRNTQAPAVLVEICFVDSDADTDLYETLGPTKIAEAIATSLPLVNFPKGTGAAYESTPKEYDGAIDWSDGNCPVSKYFRVIEVTKGDSRRIPLAGSPVAQNAIKLATELDKLREAWGKPIRVTSWYRPKDVNAAVGGATNSQHLTGGAADICPVGGDIDDFQDFCDRHWLGGLGYGAAKGFVHLDLRGGGYAEQATGSGKIRWNY